MTEKDQLSSTNVVSNAPRPTRISIPRTDRSLNFSTVSSTPSSPVDSMWRINLCSDNFRPGGKPREREGGGELNDF